MQPNPSTSIPPLGGSSQTNTNDHMEKIQNDRLPLTSYPQLSSKPRRRRHLTFRPDTDQSGTDGEQSRTGTPKVIRNEPSWSQVVGRKGRDRRGTPGIPRPTVSRTKTQPRRPPNNFKMHTTDTRSTVTVKLKENVTCLVEGATVTADDILVEMKKVIPQPKEAGINVEEFARISGGRIRVVCRTLQEADKLISLLKASANLDGEVESLRRPRLAIYGVPKEVDKDELERILNSEGLGEAEVKFKFGHKDAKGVNWVIEVHHASREAFLTRARIQIGWISCLIKPHAKLIHCYKCQLYGHLQASCSASGPTCRWCAGAHRGEACKEKHNKAVYKCAGCIKNKMASKNHASGDSAKCGYYKIKMEAFHRGIDYGP